MMRLATYCRRMLMLPASKLAWLRFRILPEVDVIFTARMYQMSRPGQPAARRSEDNILAAY